VTQDEYPITTQNYQSIITENSNPASSFVELGWTTKTIQLINPLPSTNWKLRIDVYEVGNGDQLVKSNSQSDPLRTNSVSGFNEIYLDCNYSATRTAGGGVIRPGTQPIQVIATETFASEDTIQCDDVSNFVLNSQITFQGSVFGGLTIETPYFVKTISTITKRITISASLIAGIAGPTLALTDGTGSMEVIVQVGSGLVWSDPIMYHNGVKLTYGSMLKISQTNSTGNSITCNSTGGLVVGDPIKFSSTMFGNVSPHLLYYVESIIDGNEFTISETYGGTPVIMTDANGGAIAITNDYTIGQVENSVTAKIIFSRDDYNEDTDYFSYTVFGETEPAQYGYTIPETQVFKLTDTSTTFNLINYVGDANTDNAVVEHNGLRLVNTTDYTINNSTNVLTLNFTPSVDDTIAVTSYNDTQRQYFTTNYNSYSGSKSVSPIILIENDISNPLATTLVSATSSTGNVITASSTTGFVTGQTVQFKTSSTTIGNLDVNGQVYWVSSIINGTDFTICEDQADVGIPANEFDPGTDTGLIAAVVGGLPAVRVTTGQAHGFAENDLIRIDGTLGSIELNNNTYYAKIIDSTRFDLYESPYDPALVPAVPNTPVTNITSYISGGYTWLDKLFTLVTTTATATTATLNLITVTSTSDLELGTPIIFTGTTFGNIVEGTTYYVKEKTNATQFKISATRDGEAFTLSTASGTMSVTQWEQINVDRLWVTVNGYRVPSSSLVINPDNNLSILTTIIPSDVIIITNMIPTATPNQEIYLDKVNKSNIQTVYRANPETRTWLMADLYNTDETIYVNDVNRITNTIITENVCPAAESDGSYQIGLTADKRIICQIVVYNATTSTYIDSTDYSVIIVNLAPILKITSGVTAGDNLVITVIEGNLIYINGEQIRFSDVDFALNSLSGIQRGANGTGEQAFIAKYSEVYSILSENLLPTVDLTTSWNSFVYNPTEGDPLQISNTSAANFLKADVS